MRYAYAAGLAVLTSIWCGSATAETTLCTEITSVPVTIKAQGIYCFKKDLTSSVASGNIIQINASNVTIDMNGRKLGGFTAGANTQVVGIAATNRRNITLRNGTVQGFRRGIVIDGTTDSTGYVLEDLRIEGNTQTGIEVGGTNGIVRNNLVTNTGLASLLNNTAIGILLKDSSRAVVRGNLISYVLGTSQARGVSVDGSSMVEISDNTILDVGAAYGAISESMRGIPPPLPWPAIVCSIWSATILRSASTNPSLSTDSTATTTPRAAINMGSRAATSA